MAYKSKFKGKEIDDRLYLVKELSEEIKDKQDNIEDLEDIRDGANKGATALQSIPDEYVTETELEGKGYATVTQVNEKQDAILDLDTIRTNSEKGATAKQYKGYLYYFRIKEGSTYIADWHPCRRKSDGVEGFWDCVTQQFIEPI